VYPDKIIDTRSLTQLSEKLSPKIEKKPTITIQSSSNLRSRVSSKQDLFDDVYETLSDSHYDHEDFSEDQLIE